MYMYIYGFDLIQIYHNISVGELRIFLYCNIASNKAYNKLLYVEVFPPF